MADRDPCPRGHRDCARGFYCDVTGHCWECSAITSQWCDPTECQGGDRGGKNCPECCLLPELLGHCPPADHTAYKDRCTIPEPPPPPAADPLVVAQQAACSSQAGPCVPPGSWADYYYGERITPEQQVCAVAPWQREMFGAVDAALHVRYAELMGVPPVWEPPPPPPTAPRAAAEAISAAAEAGVQGVMQAMQAMMAGGGEDGGGGMQIMTGADLQEMMMGAQQQQEKQQQKQQKQEKQDPSAAAAAATDADPTKASAKQEKIPAKQKQQKHQQQKHQQEKTPSKQKQQKKQKQKSCWVEDKSGTHTCKTDSDCGVDGRSCKQRVCSKYGFCSGGPAE
jgi:hypothetical protein